MKMNRLITPQVEEDFKDYPLYSQDGKKKDAVCVCAFGAGNVRWYAMEADIREDDTTFFGVVTGLYETEYGYFSANEMANVKVNNPALGVDIVVEQLPLLRNVPLGEIADSELQDFLSRLYDKD